MKTHEEKLSSSVYPGRGIIIGMTPNGRNIVQIYWIMGRSVNSRNRIFEYVGTTLRTRAFDESKLSDPSLVIYNAMQVHKNMHIVTNGDQTDTILDFIELDSGFRKALDTREFEPDKPNFTPRISGIADAGEKSYKISVLKTIDNNENLGQRNYYEYTTFINGVGHCITTYEDDGNPLPSFSGEPYTVGLLDELSDNAEKFWNLLDKDNRVSLAVKFIDVMSGDTAIKIINKNEEA